MEEEKKIIEKYPEIEITFLEVLQIHTAGDPMKEAVIWTDLKAKEISEYMKEKKRNASPYIVRQLLKKHGYVKRKAKKEETMKNVEYRDEQFQKIEKLRKEYSSSKNPMISIDVKKKELLGNFYRDGHLYTKEEIKTLDHDFPSYSEGIVIPQGIYDLKQNKGFITLGTSKETSEFICECVENWWNNYGKLDYPEANEILVLADGGGGNASNRYIFKYDLQELVNRIKIGIRMTHYPPYTSKYNPIEHRLFPHVTRSCEGVVFKSIELVKQLMEKTKTRTGLKVVVNILDKVYATGREATKEFLDNMPIIFDEDLPRLNYRAVPASLNVGG